MRDRLLIIGLVLLGLWLLGLVVSYTLGGAIHLLLVGGAVLVSIWVIKRIRK